jgi:Leucine rich repeat
LGMGNCNWLSKSPFDIDRLCQPTNDAYDLCRETCRNCGPNATMVPSLAPTGRVSEEPSKGPSPEPSTSPSPVLSPSVNGASDIPSAAPVALSAPSLLPSIAPANGVSLEGLLLGASPTSSDELATAGSPQQLAMAWVQLGLDNNDFGASVSDAQTLQLWSLATFAFSTGYDATWLTNGGNDECVWDGVSCDSTTGSVITINLQSRSLRGTIPPELFLLEQLQQLILSSNRIQGRIPKLLGSFQQLQDLRMDRNNLSGTVPTSIGNLSELRILYMERNPQITGTLPSSVEQLSMLQELVFYYTDITGVIPSGVCTLPKLQSLILDCTKTVCDCWTKCMYLCGGSSGVACNR